MRALAARPYRQEPTRLPVVTLRDVIGLNARCGVCHGRMVVEVPDYYPGRVSCLACGREVAEVVTALPVAIERAAWAEMAPRVGRPAKGVTP